MRRFTFRRTAVRGWRPVSAFTGVAVLWLLLPDTALGTASSTANRCLRHVVFNIPATAASYSTIAGVLAGVCFLALTIVATGERRPQNRELTREAQPAQDASIVLAETFVALIIVSLMYAVLAGEQQPPAGRVASEEVIAGIGFATSGLMTVFALALTFEGFGAATQAAKWLRRSGLS